MERTKEDRESLGEPLLYEWVEIMVAAAVSLRLGTRYPLRMKVIAND
jgi:hypothetical protein